MQIITLTACFSFLIIIGGMAGVSEASSPLMEPSIGKNMMITFPLLLNVLCTLPLMMIGAAGLAWLSRAKENYTHTHPAEQFIIFASFIGMIISGAGIAYFHSAPHKHSWLWDQLPLVLTVITIFSVFVKERITVKWPMLFYVILLFLATIYLSYLYSHSYESTAFFVEYRHHGFIAAIPIIIALLCLFLLPPRYTGEHYWRHSLFIYILAKFAEIYHLNIHDMSSGLLGGHTVYHILIIVPAYLYFMHLKKRLPLKIDRESYEK